MKKEKQFSIFKKIHNNYFFLIKENDEYQLLLWDKSIDWREIKNLILLNETEADKLITFLFNKDNITFESLKKCHYRKKKLPLIQTIDCHGFTEKNDCTVRATANVCEVSYNEAYEKLKLFGRKAQKGIVYKIFLIENNYTLFNKNFIQMEKDEYFPKTIKQFLANYQEGTFLIGVSRHVFCIKDGKCYDRGLLANKRIKYIYSVESKD